MLRLVVVVVILATFHAPTSAIKCYNDTTLDNLQDFEFEVPHSSSPEEYHRYWRNWHNNYILFGKFDGDPTVDTTIEVGYYANSSAISLISRVVVDCAANTWASYLINNVTLVDVLYQTGELNTSCRAGERWDLWLHTMQPLMINWLYGDQYLQYNITDQTSWDNGQRRYRNNRGEPYILAQGNPRWRIRSVPLPAATGADKATRYTVHTTGAAYVTRLAMGECVAWPEHMSINCSAAAEWVTQRSGRNPNQELDPLNQDSIKYYGYGMKYFGAANVLFQPQCLHDVYYQHLQTMIHPDETSVQGSTWCCCVDMETGKIYQDDPVKYCATNLNNKCKITCMETYQYDLWHLNTEQNATALS